MAAILPGFSVIKNFFCHLQVFDYIDQGHNPQLYTKDCMEKALAKNENVKGKMDAFAVSMTQGARASATMILT